MRTIKERFDAFIDRHPGDGCWEWTGALNEAGYGKFHVNPSVGTVLAHRWSFMMETKVVLTEEEILDHLCRNHKCVRPSHLENVTLKENTLRGQSDAAKNARKDACSKGHPFTPLNTYVNAKGGRQCRTCMREATRKYSMLHPDRARTRVRRFRAARV